MTVPLNILPWPEVDFQEFGEVEVRPRDRMQQLAAGFLARNWATIPHVTHHDEIDVTALEEARKAWNLANPDSRLTILLPVVKALAASLRAHPVFNTSLSADGKSMAWKSYVNIGVAIDTPKGLLVGVVCDCDAKPVIEIAGEIAALSAKARAKGLSLAEMSGGSMTISSLGHIGGTGFTPIVNAPEVAILGMTKLQQRPMPSADGGIEWRLMLPLSLSYDHRVVNGADAARFVSTIGEELDAFRFA